MITAIFETGQLTSGTKHGANALIVEQVVATAFVIRNTPGDIVMHNFHDHQRACKFAAEISKTYTLD